MKTIPSIVKKNITLLLRSKASAVILILGPLLIILFAGLAFDNTNTYRLTLGTYSGAYNNLSDSFLYALAQNEFKVLKYNDQDACVADVKKGAVHSCLVFSDDFELGDDLRNEITFYVDHSKVNLVGTLLETMSKRVSAREGELSLNLTQVLIEKIDSISVAINQRRATLIELTTENDEVAETVIQTAGLVNAMNLTFVLSSAEISNMSFTNDIISTRISEIEGVANDSITGAYDYISDVDDIVDSSSLSANEKGNITASLVDALDNLEELEDELNSTSVTAFQDVDKLTNLTDNVVASLTSLRTNLAAASQKKAMLTVNLQAIDEAINQSLVKIFLLQNAFNRIDKDIKSIKVTKAGSIVNPVTTTVMPIAAEKTNLNYIFPSLIILIIMFTGILLPSTLIQIEKKSKAFFRNFMTPVSDITNILATLATSFLLLLVQLIIVFFIGLLFFAGEIFSGIFSTIIVFLFTIAVFVSLGMLIGYVCKSEETSLLASISISSLMLFISDMILPIESMPSYIAFFAEYNPFVIATSLLKKTTLFNLSLLEVSGDLLFLLGYAVLLFALVFLVQVLSKKQVVKKYIETVAPKLPERLRRKHAKK